MREPVSTLRTLDLPGGSLVPFTATRANAIGSSTGGSG